MRTINITIAILLTLVWFGCESQNPERFNSQQQDLKSSQSDDAKAEVEELIECGGKTLSIHADHGPCDTVVGDSSKFEEKKEEEKPVKNDEPEEEEEVVEEEPEEEEPQLDPAANGDPNVVVFRIKAGTGNGVWNTQAEMVTVKVGNVLRFVNDDNVTHRLHTGGEPCPHGPGPGFAPGETYDCNITQTITPPADPAANTQTYNHNVGRNAKFWVKADP